MTRPTADFLTALAAEGSPAELSALELGTGTGRIALPLSARGVLVHGIDLSQAMVARLRAKPGAERVTVTACDFPTAAAGRSFRLIYLVCNTIGNLASQDDQVECFRNASAHLEPGGHFVIEVGLPDLRWLPPGQAKYPPLCTPAFACQGRCRAAPTRVFCAPWGEGVRRAASRALPLFLLANREWRYTFIWDCYAVGTPDMRTRSVREGGSRAETIWPNQATGDRRLPGRPGPGLARLTTRPSGTAASLPPAEASGSGISE